MSLRRMRFNISFALVQYVNNRKLWKKSDMQIEKQIKQENCTMI